MYLIVGLGNPGKKYGPTRHNFGRLVLESLAEDLNLQWEKHKSDTDIVTTKFEGTKAILCLPHQYMNESGIGVQQAAHFFKIKAENIIIIYDDIDLDFERIKISKNKTAGTHNGIKSVIHQLDSSDFIRVRLGIGPQDKVAEKFVLEKFSKGEVVKLPEIVDRAKAAIDMIISKGLEKTANEFN